MDALQQADAAYAKAEAKAVAIVQKAAQKAAPKAGAVIAQAWAVKAKAYAGAKAPMPKQPPPFVPVVAPPPGVPGAGEVPHPPPPGAGVAFAAAAAAAGPGMVRGYPYLAKAAAYQRDPNAPPIHAASDNDVEGRMAKSRRIAGSGLTVAKGFNKVMRELNQADSRLHYDPKATAVTAARGAQDICAILDQRLQNEFGEQDWE